MTRRINGRILVQKSRCVRNIAAIPKPRLRKRAQPERTHTRTVMFRIFSASCGEEKRIKGRENRTEKRQKRTERRGQRAERRR